MRGQQISLWHPRHFLSPNMTRESTLRAMKTILKRSKWSPHIASCNVVSIIFNNWANFEAIWQLASVLGYVWAKKMSMAFQAAKSGMNVIFTPQSSQSWKNYVMSCRNNHRQIFALCTLNGVQTIVGEEDDSNLGRFSKSSSIDN